MKTLVTGGAGFIGSNFVNYLLRDEKISQEISKITVLDKLTYAGNLRNLDKLTNNTKFEFQLGDINDKKLLCTLIEKCDWIINFAAETHVDRSITNPDNFIYSNINGTYNLIKICNELRNKNFLQISTDEVYGSIYEGSASENAPLNPSSPYSSSKASADLIVKSFVKTHGIHAIITRCSNNYGLNQNNEKMIPTIIQNISRDLPIPV